MTLLIKSWLSQKPSVAAPAAGVTHPLEGAAAYMWAVINGENYKMTPTFFRAFCGLIFAAKPKQWAANTALEMGQVVYTTEGRFFFAKRELSAPENITKPGTGENWTTDFGEWGAGGGGGNAGGGGVVFLSGAVNPTADAPAGAALLSGYINTADNTLWVKKAAADPNAWVKVSGAGATGGLTEPQVLALLKTAAAEATEAERGTVTLATIRATISAGLAVVNSTLRAAALKVFTDYLPAPSGGMGLRWKADGSGLENYEITNDVVIPIVRFVRVGHGSAAPTLTGGTPGSGWRGGVFATQPVAANTDGDALYLGAMWPAAPDEDAYDYYQFRALIDTANLSAAVVWAAEGKRGQENPPDTTTGLSEQEVLDVLASEAAKALEARRGTLSLAEVRALFDPVTIPIVGAGSDTPRLDDGAMPMALPLPAGLTAANLSAAGAVLNGTYHTGVSSFIMSPLDVATLPNEKPASGNSASRGDGYWQASGGLTRWRVWKDGDAVKIDWVEEADFPTYFTSLTIQVPRVTLFRKGLLGLEEAQAAKEAAETAQATADAKAPKTTYDFFISPAPEAPSAPAANIFIPPTDPIAPQGALDERVPVSFTFRKAAGDVTVETSAYDLRLATADAPVVLEDPDDATKEFIVWFISETSLGWNYRNADDSAIANHGVLFVSVTFISRLTLDSTNIPPTLDRGASDNGSLVNTKLLKRVIAMFPSVGQLGQQLADIMSLVKILKRDGVSQFLSHISLGADTVSVAQGFSRLVDLRDLTMSVADSAMNFIQEGSGAAWAQATKIVSGLGAADGHLVGLKFKAVAAGNVLQLRKADGTLMNLITMKADGSVHFNSYHDAANEDDAHTIHVATDWSPTDFTGGAYAEAELPVIGEHWPGSAEAGSTDYNGATFAPFVVRLLERGVVAQAARVQLPALDPVAQANVHFAAEAVWVDTDVQLLSAGSEAVVQYRYIRRTDAPEVFARVYVQVRLLVTRGSVTGRVDDLHLNSTITYTTHSRIEAGTTEAPALLTAAVGGELVFYSAAPLPAAPRTPTIAVYRAADGGESSYNDFYPERGSFDYDQVVLNTDIVSEFRHAAHTDYISHSELYAYARLAASMWVYAIGRLVSGSARVMVGIETGFSAGAENGDGKAFLVEGEGGGDGEGTPVTNGAPDYAHLGTPDMDSGTFTTGADGGTVGGTPGVSVADSKILFGADHKAEGAIKFINDNVAYPTTNLPPGAVYDATTGELTLPGSADANTHWIVCASVRVRANSAGGGGGDRVWVRGSIFHGDDERHSNQTYIRYSDLDGDANQAGANSDTLSYTNEARLSVTGSVVADGVKKTKIQISAFTQNIAQLNGADDPNANVAILGAHVHAYKITKALGGGGGGGLQVSDILDVAANASALGGENSYDVDLSGALFLAGIFSSAVGRTIFATRDSSGVWVREAEQRVLSVSDTGFTLSASTALNVRAYSA